MKLLQRSVNVLWVFWILGLVCLCEVAGLSDSSLPTGSGSNGEDVKGPPDPIQRRLSKNIFKNLNSTSSSNSTTENSQQKRSAGAVEILEAGSNFRTNGSPRVLKRGPFFGGKHEAFGSSGAPGTFRSSGASSRFGSSGAPGGFDSVGGSGTHFSDPIFTLRNSLALKNAGYDSSVPFETVSSVPVIAIPGSDIPPPVYSYGGILPPAPPPSPSVTINGGGSSYGNPSPYRPGGGEGGGGSTFISSTTPSPEIIFPPAPVTSSPGPIPIGPPTGTSIPIIGGGSVSPPAPIIGGGGSGSVLPPSPPPEDIFPPAPPPSEEQFEEFDDGVGRRLKIPGRPGASGGSGAAGAPGRRSGAGAGVAGATGGSSAKTNTRFVTPSNHLPTTSRFTSKETFQAPSLSNLGKTRSGGTLRRERLRDKVKKFTTTAVEEAILDPTSDEILVDDPNVITDFVFSDIKCFKTRQNEYFGATIHMKSGFHLPYIRDRPQDPLTSEECRLDLMEGTRGSYHMSVADLRGCGVEQCGEAMCLTMVFPRVPMLALADDEVTTIKCIPQKSTMSDTKSISFAGDSMENRRSSSTVEGGIQEFIAEVGVFRQNPGSANGLFVKRVNSGGVVQLGEPLQLRSVVRGTDGWKHSKLTDVKVWRMRDNLSTKLDNLDPNDASEVITLVDGHGCRNEEYLVIADNHPIKDPRNDMVHHFTFKAFLFRGQRVNEPLIVTARVHACQESQDCIMECRLHGRRKRSPVELHNSSSIVHDYDTQLALRVVGLKDHPSSILDDEFPFEYSASSSTVVNHTGLDTGSMSCKEKMFASGFGGGFVMLMICGLALALYTYIRQGRLQNNRKSQVSSPATTPFRYPPPSGRPINAPYQKPLPPPPPSESTSAAASSTQQGRNNQTSPTTEGTTRDESMSQVEKLLKELVKNNNNNNDNSKVSERGKASKIKNDSGGKQKETPSEYACIDETNSSSTSSATSSSEDLRKSKRSKDGVYILYCYDKDKKNKVVLPKSAPSSSRMRRKHLQQIGRMTEDDFYDDDDIIREGDDSEAIASQTEDPTDESDEYGEIGRNGQNNMNNNNNAPCGIVMNQGVRRTVREVKKKSKQNNVLANASTRCRGNIRRRISSVYREGYLNGLRGVVAAAVGSKGGGSFPLRYKKSPSTGNIPEALGSDDGDTGGKRINFSVRERRSQKSRRQNHQHKQSKYHQDQYSSEGMISEATLSDLDSAYSGSNCSKLTEVYEMKRGGGAKNASGPYPEFRKSNQNRLDVQRQIMNNNCMGKLELRRTTSSPNNSENASGSGVTVGLGSPRLSPGETKATHFVTRDDSTTKILIVPETHV